jgi:hypothetical protein
MLAGQRFSRHDLLPPGDLCDPHLTQTRLVLGQFGLQLLLIPLV